MSADAVQRLVAKHATAAARSCRSISSKHVTPHTLRHTAAMTLQVRGIAFDASFGVVSDRESVRDFSFGASAVPAWRYGRHAL
jgi:integrase